MNGYTIHCSEQQTRKALELGAPIGVIPDGLIIPTAEQMLGWLGERDIYINILWDDCIYGVTILNTDKGCINPPNRIFTSRKEAILDAIDAALEYLTNKKSNKI